MAVDTTYSTLSGYITSGICFAGDEPLASMARVLLNKSNTVVFDTDTNGDCRFPSDRTITITGNVTAGSLTADAMVVNGLAVASLNVTGDATFSAATGTSLTVSGDLESTTTANGLILRAPNAGRWRLTVDNSGVITTTSL